jgi:Zn-dependent protease with chaperone function
MSRRRFERAAKEQSRTDFLAAPYDRPGSQVRITFDPENADIALMTTRGYTLGRILSDARTVAQGLARPRSDFITYQGSKTVTADVELNKYLRRQPRRTDFDLDLAALARLLKAAQLPEPVVIGIDPDDAEQAIVQAGGGTRTLDGITFYRLDQIPTDASLHFAFTPVPFAAAIGIALLALVLAIPITAAWCVGRTINRTTDPTPAPVTLSPDEVQARYDRGKPVWIARLAPLIFCIPLMLARGLNLSRLMLSWQMLSPVPIPVVFLAVAGIVVLTPVGVGSTLRWRRRKVRSAEALPVDAPGSRAQPALTVTLVMALLTISLFLMPFFLLLRVFPAYTPHDLQVRRTLMLSVLGFTFVFWIAILVWWCRRFASTGGMGLRRTLTDGPWFETVHAMASRAGVTVRSVVLITSAVPNAYASVFSTVSLTTGLIEALDTDEVCAVVAHEIGHLKARHPIRTLVTGVILLVAITLGWIWLRSHLSGGVGQVLDIPLLFLIVSNLLTALLLGPIRRGREREADRYAVEWTGDRELVIRALTKVSQGIGNPGRLKPSDEAMSSHPSLQNRIDAIRRGS